MTLYEKILKYDNSKLNALYYVDKKVSFIELLSNIRKLVTYFSKKGIKKGDIVTVVLPNIPSSIYTFYALDALGAIQNIIHPLTTFDKIIETMEQTGSNNVVLLATNYQANEKYINESKYHFFFANPMYDNSLLLRHMFYFKFKKPKENSHIFLLNKFYKEKECMNIESRDENETSIYLHSGGTTGVPKIICLSDYVINNLVDKIEGIVEGSIEGKSMLAVLPTFHGFGLGMGVHGPLSCGASSALMMKFNADKVIEWINENKVNLIIGVPVLYQKLMKNEKFASSKLTNLEFCFIGGDNVPPSLIKDFNEVMKNNNSNCLLLEGYGLTETVTVCNVNTKSNFKIGSVGKPLIDINVKILDDEFNELSFNEIGEVYINSNTIMNGYLNDDKSTNKTILDINGNKYVRTGDLGYLDNDGFLFLKGRKKRMFKISGLNVYPSEVEKIISDFEDIIDCSLEYFMEPKPHLILYVIKNKYSNKSNEEISKIIMNELTNKVLKYSLPQQIVFMDEFPKTKVGKINHQGFIDPLKGE